MDPLTSAKLLGLGALHSPARTLRQATRIAGFAGVTAALLSAYASVDSLADPADADARRDRWVGTWCDALLALFRIDAVVTGSATRGGGRGRLIVANHRSTIDVALMLRCFGGHMVSKADVSGWPIIGRAAAKVGTVFVERSDSRSGAAAMRKIRKLLQDGRTVNVFPEGTTFPDDLVRPFHRGTFVAATHSGAEIVPVGIAYAGADAAYANESLTEHMLRVAGARTTRAAIAVGTPFECSPESRAIDLCARAQREVQALVMQARQTCESFGTI